MLFSIDVATLAVCFGIISTLQCVALFIQYRAYPEDNSIGLWTTGSVCIATGFLANLLRDIQSIHLYIVVLYNMSFVVGFSFIYIGLMKFDSKTVDYKRLIVIGSLAFASLLYFTFVDYSIPCRRITTSLTCAFMSLTSATALRSYTMQSRISRVLAAIFVFTAGALLATSVLPLLAGQSTVPHDKATPLVVTYFILIITSTLWTFGLIILVNNKLNEEISAAKLFLESTLDGLSAHIAIIDANGDIVLVNKAWRDFASSNGADPERVSSGTNYITACTATPPNALDEPLFFADGIRSVLDGTRTLFTMEYACHSANTQRWFLGRVTPFPGGGPKRAVIAHEDITERKLMEIALVESNRKLELLTNEDGLTQIANRRHFDAVLNAECSRHARSGSALSLLILDIDHFKSFNDTYGHVQGDECLRSVARALTQCVKRPTDLVARYGGEEFVCLLPDTHLIGAVSVAENMRKHIEQLAIPHANSSVSSIVTVSIGLVAIRCDQNTTPEDIVRQADELLYQAKNEGRNRIRFRGVDDDYCAQGPDSEDATFKVSISKAHASGNAFIDSQHANLVHLVNELLRYMFSGNDLSELRTHMAAILKHVEIHFNDEDDILAESHYQHAAQHAEEHRRLLGQCAHLIDDPSDLKQLQTEIIQYIVHDLVMQHMIQEDAKYFEHLRDRADHPEQGRPASREPRPPSGA